MSQKFFDIIPPEENIEFVKAEIKTKKQEEDPEEGKIEIKKAIEKIRREPEPPSAKKQRRIFFNFKKIFFGFLGLGIIAGLILFFNYFMASSKVEIKIWPKISNISLKDEFIVDPKASQPDLAKKIFPGQIISTQIADLQQFSATGKAIKEQKAEGIIRIYNAYSVSPQALVAQTRFISSDGKTFKLLAKTTIPGAAYDKSKLVPGYVDVKIQAVDSGEEYNIGPSTFSIPGFAGTSKYTTFYGKSVNAMTEGFKGEKSQVSSSDLDNAKKNLEEKMKKAGKDLLDKKAAKDSILLEDSFTYEFANENFSNRVGDFADSFTLKKSLTIKGMVFARSYADSLLKNLLESKISSSEKIKEGTLALTFNSQTQKTGQADVVLKAAAQTYPEIDLTALKKSIANKPFKEIKMLLGDNVQFEKIEIKNLNFFNTKVPEKLDNIKISLSID